MAQFATASQPSASDTAKFTTTSKVPMTQLNFKQPAKWQWLSQVYNNQQNTNGTAKFETASQWFSQVYNNQQNTNDTTMFATASQVPMTLLGLQQPAKYQWHS